MPAIRALLLVFAVGCHSSSAESPPAPRDDADVSATRGDIERYVGAGRTPAAFSTLASSLERVRRGPMSIAEDAELRMLALALPLIDGVRLQSIDEQVDAHALTVWPALLADPLTARAQHDVTPYVNETTRHYLDRMCEGPLATECHTTPTAQRAIVVRAVALQRADQRMRGALGRCTLCGSASEGGWDELGHKWETLAADAHRDVTELQ
jgi:hypothetical protein